ncbi:hypothetical protein MNAN1_003268 [Malassezia nana]|uniref:Trafficking protein particle complex subunit n=1 Tax=Malassezia nana TaxID=180528 RepID=A0AAF0ELJ8_9BASI|nr:hypothetical protein MNAN1_003268 [Malassezia nana]
MAHSPVVDSTVYGYQSSTQLTFLLFLDSSARNATDADVQTLFRALHNIYGTYMSNPFAAIPPGDLLPSKPMETEALHAYLTPSAEPGCAPITSHLFDQRVSAICGWTLDQAAV